LAQHCGRSHHVTVNWPVADPPAVVTVIKPEAAPDGTSTVILAAESEMTGAPTPEAKLTLAPERLVPLIVTFLPGGPDAGLTVVTVGPKS
jgi:hypothetical protein